MRKDNEHVRDSIAHEEKLKTDFNAVGLASYFATSEDNDVNWKDAFEVKVLDLLSHCRMNENSRVKMTVQEKTGFAQRVLKNSAEDVWNDL